MYIYIYIFTSYVAYTAFFSCGRRLFPMFDTFVVPAVLLTQHLFPAVGALFPLFDMFLPSMLLTQHLFPAAGAFFQFVVTVLPAMLLMQHFFPATGALFSYV